VLVGSEIPEAELYKMNIRSPYERNIIQHFHTQEHIFDYIFWSLGIREEKVSHPILITEPIAAPNYTRDMMLELVFECYSAPAINFGIDAMFAFRHNLPSVSDGMLIYVGHQSSHIIPVLNNRMVHNCARRINLGCFNITGALLKQLQTRYFYNRGLITWPLAQEIIFEHCYVATNYIEELQNRIYRNQRKIQLPWSMPAMLSQDVVQKRQKQKQEQAQRLKELMQKRREERKRADELELNKLQKIEDLEKDDPDAFMDALMEEGFADVAELRRKMKKIMARLQIVHEEGNKYDLLDIPDEELSPQQLNRKKMQKIQKAAQIAREEKKARELEEKEKMEKLKGENPQAYLEQLQTRRREIQEKIETRNKTKVDLQNRHSRASQRRLRALAELGSEKQEDNFGEKDEDWEVYREVQKDNSSEEEEDQNLLTEIDNELSKLDPAFNPDKPEWRAPTAEDYQLFLEVDRIRPPEILFQPSIVGLEQTGLAQALENVFGIFSAKQASEMARNIFITVSYK
jgi:actin-related protein 5